MTKRTTYFGTSYKSLNDIRLRKVRLRIDLTKDNNKIVGLWNGLIHKPKDKDAPTQRFSGASNVGAGVLDGLVLAWKLYRMFDGKQSPSLFSSKFSLFRKKKKQARRQLNELWESPADKHYFHH